LLGPDRFFKQDTAVRNVLPFLYLGAYLSAQAALTDFDQQKLETFWSQNQTSDTWAASAADLTLQLETSYAENGTKSFTENASFAPWLYTSAWLRLGQESQLIRENEDLCKAFVELGKIPEASHLLIQSLRFGDHFCKAAEILTRLHQALPDKTKDYANLAVAYAVVFDQEFPKDWPHHQVNPEAVPVANTDPVERYRFYVESNEAQHLDLDLKELSVTELMFLVDSLISLEELRYAQKSKFNRSKLDRAFSSIIYDRSRIKNKEYDWTYTTYRLQDIEQNGGICVDQAYYGSAIGKGRGIPTLYFSGQGSDGGHAWFGYMERPGKWSLDCGRYESQNYPIGNARNPQAWQSINDAELEFLFRDPTKYPNEKYSQTALTWAMEHSHSNHDPAKLMNYYQDARNLAPENPDLWRYERFYLTRLDTEPSRLKTFYESWIQQFSKNSDMKVEGQTYLLEILNKTQDPVAPDLQKEIVRENRRKRFDLGIGAGAGSILEHLEAKQWAEAEDEFKKMVRQFDDQGGGNLFYQMIQPYIQTCLEEGQHQMAEDALKFADKKIHRSPDSILEEEFQKLETAVKRRKK
jgi:hypothetical protein